MVVYAMEKSLTKGEKSAKIRSCCFIWGSQGGLSAKVTLIRDLQKGRQPCGNLEKEVSGKRDQLIQKCECA